MSGKISVVLDILTRSVAAGDKLLVFSHSLHTLSLLEMLLAEMPLPPPAAGSGKGEGGDVREGSAAETAAGGDSGAGKWRQGVHWFR